MSAHTVLHRIISADGKQVSEAFRAGYPWKGLKESSGLRLQLDIMTKPVISEDNGLNCYMLCMVCLQTYLCEVEVICLYPDKKCTLYSVLQTSLSVLFL